MSYFTTHLADSILQRSEEKLLLARTLKQASK